MEGITALTQGDLVLKAQEITFNSTAVSRLTKLNKTDIRKGNIDDLKLDAGL